MAKKRGKTKGLKSVVTNSKPPAVEAPSDGESIVIVASSPIPAGSAKVCRLCETTEGPFLKIFSGEKNTAKKIEELMPFGVSENDELPHNICFRCSAKVEELHEFVQKCIKTQKNLYNSLGKKYPEAKVKTHRSIWEEKLNRSNITNDDICDAVIKKAMEGIKDVPLQVLSETTKTSESKAEKVSAELSKSPSQAPKKISNVTAEEKEPEIKKRTSTLKENTSVSVPSLQLCLDKCDNKTPAKKRSSRLNHDEPLHEGVPSRKKQKTALKKSPNSHKICENVIEKTPSTPMHTKLDEENVKTSAKCDGEDVNLEKGAKTVAPVEPFNIMDHVSMIKVNGVGVLYQCKLCNRNFLKKNLVLTHWCAKNGAAKNDFIKRAAPPEPPKVSTVKYIYTKVDDSKKQQGVEGKSAQFQTNVDSKKAEVEILEEKVNEPKPKPKIGPASKVKRTIIDSTTISSGPKEPPASQEKSSVLQMAAVPSFSCRYKLVPGPNNTFSLVEAQQPDQKEEKNDKEHLTIKKILPKEDDSKVESSSKQRKVLRSENTFHKPGPASKRSNITELTGPTDRDQSETANQPYPVGLFQTVGRHPKKEKPPAANVVPFATSSQKKQSYTVVQTGNPSKLLISAKPQHQQEEPPKKKHSKGKPAELGNPIAQEPFPVTLEDNSQPKDSGFFTFINVDPLLQPSYVLPTDNSIIQESQISTSNRAQKPPKPGKNDKYTCNMCSAVFTREQKLLVHIHSHYNKMDEEDQKRAEKPSRKKSKKSV